MNNLFSLMFIISFEHPEKEWTIYKKRFMVVQNIPLNMQKGNEHSIIKKVRRAFFALFVWIFFCKIFDFKTLLWPPGEVLVVLQYAEECSSAFLTQKNLQNQYCVGPTYTIFFRNRASVRWFALNIFFRVLEQILKNFDFWFYTGIHPASCQEWFGESLDEKISCANLQSAQFYWRHCRCIFYV